MHNEGMNGGDVGIFVVAGSRERSAEGKGVRSKE